MAFCKDSRLRKTRKSLMEYLYCNKENNLTISLLAYAVSCQIALFFKDSFKASFKVKSIMLVQTFADIQVFKN